MGIGGSVEQSMAPEPADAEAARLQGGTAFRGRRIAAFRQCLKYGCGQPVDQGLLGPGNAAR